MGGGGASTNSTSYQKPRKSPGRRKYGEVGNGFKSQAEYEAYLEWSRNPTTTLKIKQDTDKKSSGSSGKTIMAPSIGRVTNKTISRPNEYDFTYNTDYNTGTLGNGVDAEAAIEDWLNYRAEREEIATYNAKEDKRKRAPDELSASRTMDLSIATKDGKKPHKENTITQPYAEYPSTESTNQPLGIY